MDAKAADPDGALDGAIEHAREGQANTAPTAEPVEAAPGGGQGAADREVAGAALVDDAPAATDGPSPRLALDGFTGPLDQLLILARAHKIDLLHISLAALVEQLAAALRQAPAAVALARKGDWVVMAAWLVQLRSLLLLPVDAPARQVAELEADQLRERLLTMQTMRSLAGWLEQRPQLGRDVFARGQPEMFGVSVEAGQAIDVVEFLWASLALFDDEPEPDTVTVYRPLHLDLYPVAEARARILRLLEETPEGGPFERFLPVLHADEPSDSRRALRRRSGWASTLIAGLELAKQGAVAMEQGREFEPIHVAPA
jgi:segregation and condensation protein A